MLKNMIFYCFTEFCNTDNYTAGTVALIDYVVDETEAGCSLLNMVMHVAKVTTTPVYH